MSNVWTRQPQTAVRVKRNGIGKDIAFVFSGSVQNRDLVKGLQGSAASSDSYVPSKPGMAFRGARVTSGGVNFGNVQPITGDTWTVLVLANPAASSNPQALFSQRKGTANYGQIDLAINSTSGLVGASGLLTAITIEEAAGSASRYAESSASTYADGGWHLYGMTRAGVGTFPSLYFDGAAISATTGGTSTGSSISTAMHTRIGNIADYTVDGAYAAQCDIAFVAVWNRVLSAREIADFYANPWALFEPLPKRRGFGVPAASSSTITSAAGASTTSTLTGASTASTTVTSAAGVSTTSTVSGSSVASASFTSAAGASTASTRIGSSVASASLSSAAGASTASTMTGVSSATGSAISTAAGSSTTSTLTGAAASVAALIEAAGSAAAATMAGSSTLDTMARPGADVLTTGWLPSTGADLYAMIDETSADDADYIYRDLAGTEPYVFDLYQAGAGYSLPAGTHTIRLRADVTSGTAQMRLLLLDSSNTTVGTGDWQAITSTWATSSFTVTTTAAATRGRIEAQA